MKKMIALCFLLLCSEASLAYNAKPSTEIKNIRVRPSVAYVLFEGCSKYARIYLSNDYYKSMFSVAMMAAASNKKVAIEFQENKSCASTEPLINYIDIAI
ncbi:hypothetical protein [Pseudoalteromonas luteoviolacea]|uniref:Uncharacterized protein n=1 Tax=Pseudoalteromonas luteoviolacea S4054 TaxID=1129367 RepID=A0A0F6AAM6_9GAMM|nr:hypothetical protein [Pseudoalteromonas luteoviolacea]AOT09533.1 hypothetical protein S4054249_17615 [Pseudoalteromonas luteoviolacea]AOT14445.1 hypothetical protein S40542_17585 [Pseudoalteromonas luteoviolacea]AOT19361.1 hypothetical protein S4054_17590 [Pseudoalteromonas luteoviolacea]KKE83208.1 hypothetical protein N479_15300 [Pseudoalteromonas luteoviolacea S4054]KZN68837.1 hypothetical protein N481_23110 [Pseudoalteromonas luteoviolacea S4047-1]